MIDGTVKEHKNKIDGHRPFNVNKSNRLTIKKGPPRFVLPVVIFSMMVAGSQYLYLNPFFPAYVE